MLGIHGFSLGLGDSPSAVTTSSGALHFANTPLLEKSFIAHCVADDVKHRFRSCVNVAGQEDACEPGDHWSEPPTEGIRKTKSCPSIRNDCRKPLSGQSNARETI